MSAQAQLASLKPIRKDRVFDLVEALGFDVSDWIATASNPSKVRANPKYCYDWSFIVAGERAIFNLWHGAMQAEGNEIVYRDNFRRNADHHRRNGGKPQWIMRGEKLDRDAATAARDKLAGVARPKIHRQSRRTSTSGSLIRLNGTFGGMTRRPAISCWREVRVPHYL